MDNDPPPPPFLNQSSYGGIGGWKTSAIKDPTRTLLLLELSGGFPWSWHDPQRIPPGQCGFNNARNVVTLVDGHVSYIKMYRHTTYNLPSCNYEPPAGYDYTWHGE